MRSWEIITGEYPPSVGGVADYTQSLCQALTNLADFQVRVWTKGEHEEAEHITPRLSVYRCARDFGLKGLQRLDWSLDRLSTPRTLLIQYVPHTYGMKGMNTAFSSWVQKRAVQHGDEVRMMFHEVAYPWVRWPLHHNLMTAVNEFMVRQMVRHARVCYVSTLAWQPRLVRLGANPGRICTLPIPSNVPAFKELTTVDAIRERYQLQANPYQSENQYPHSATQDSLKFREKREG